MEDEQLQSPPESMDASLGAAQPDVQNGDHTPEGQNGDAPESEQVEQSDGLLAQDKAELSERVAHIEKRVREQQDEIVCLKGAMADVMRRLGTVETAKSKLQTDGFVQNEHTRLLPMKPNTPSTITSTTLSDRERNAASIKGDGNDHSNTQSGGRRLPQGSPVISGASGNQRSTYMSDYMSHLSPAQNSILPSKPYMTSPRRAPAGKERPKSSISESRSVRSSAPTSARQPPRGSSAATVKKWGSMSNSIEETNGHKSPRSGSQLTSAKRSSSQGALNIKATLTTKGAKGPTYDEGCVRMYLKGRPISLYAPSYKDDYKINAPQDKPKQKLKLEWVYGYRGRDARSNLYQLPTGEIVYFSAAVVVLHDLDENSQRHYTDHTDDVKCLAIHPDKVRIASGQVAGHEKKEGKPHVRIWSSVSLETLEVFGEDHFQRAVCCVSFCGPDGGEKLLAVDESNDHVLSVWDLTKKKPKKITEMKASGDPVTACEFHPSDENTIVCCGKSQISFWTIENNRLNKKAGIFEKNDKASYIICFAFDEEGNVISGDSNGNIYVWEKGGNKITNAVEKAHEGPVFSICVLKDGTILSGGGKDRMVYHWDANLGRTGKKAEIPERFGAVRMISEGQKKLFVGTIRNCILLSTISQSNEEIDFSPVVEGHKEELWGLACLPDSHQFLTCSYDRHIYLWDAQSRTAVWMKEIAESAHCCAVHKYGDEYIAVIGNSTESKCGKFEWFAMDLGTREIIAVHQDGKEQYECVEFSPDGTKLAIGNRDNFIYVYEVLENGRKFKKIGRCKGHSSYITHIDWSEDNSTIRSNSGDYDILYWNASDCSRNTDNDINKDLEFATNNCTLSFNSIGVWPDGADGTDVNGCSMSNKKDLIVSADDFGKVTLYSYPSIQIKAVGHSYQGHSSHVTRAKFLYDDSRVISTGGRDMAVLQWQVV